LKLDLRSPYHFVSQDEEVMFLGNGSDVLEFPPREDFAYRVVRCIDYNHLGSRRYRAASNIVSGKAGEDSR
jgi:hypothetical protein